MTPKPKTARQKEQARIERIGKREDKRKKKRGGNLLRDFNLVIGKVRGKSVG